MPEERRWTLDAAREILPDVRDRTARAVADAERIARERDRHPEASPEREAIERDLGALVQRWARDMEALGADVKGLWLVDFDNGSGYYCWQWPEPALEFFHTYDEGFAGRVRIQ